MSSSIRSPGIFAVLVVFEHPDGRTLGASIARMHPDMVADLVVFEGEQSDKCESGGTITVNGVPYVERKEGEAPTPGAWHY